MVAHFACPTAETKEESGMVVLLGREHLVQERALCNDGRVLREKTGEERAW